MWKVRSQRIKEMSRQFLTWDQQDASDLYGIGEYGSDSYKIFYLNKTNIRPKDKELKRYLKEIKNGTVRTEKN